MHYPRIVYHKDYSPKMDERTREYHTRLAKSAEHHKELGPDWGEHPAYKKSEEKPAEKPSEKQSLTEEEQHVAEAASVFGKSEPKKGKGK